MKSTNYALNIISELEKTISMVNVQDTDDFIERILKAKRIFVAGSGRSLLMLRAFAMRLMHMGLTAYVVGDTVTPAIMDEDVLVIGSGSGETEGLILKARKAGKIGAQVIALTIFPDSSITKYADMTLIIPGATNKVKVNRTQSIQPGANLFEQSMLIVLDGATMKIAEIIGIDIKPASALHANLE